MAAKYYHQVNDTHVDFTDEEIEARDAVIAAWESTGKAAYAFEQLRFERNAKLAESDWMSNSDSPTMSDAWKTYRQELRDLPSNYNNSTVLGTITWPTEPS